MKLVKGYVIVLICLPMIASAATNVTLGVFGYAEVPLTTSLYIGAMQFDNETNTPETVYGDSLAIGSTIYKWNGGVPSYYTATYTTVNTGPPDFLTVTNWDNSFLLDSGEGYWIESASIVTSTVSGSVPLDGFVTNSITVGLQLCSYPYPVDRVSTNLGFVPSIGDKIYVRNEGGGYDTSTYTSVNTGPPDFLTVINWDAVITIPVGKGFWYESQANTDWVVEKPF